jgi:NADPH-dependent 2,4-dienoyl-CoA reductase/sulfur reductase-like enzyme
MESSQNHTYSSPTGTSRILQDLHSRKRYAENQNVHPRDMLKSAMAASKQAVSVGIVGAGFAGLRCADVLLRRGVKVTIFEARNRVGGRVGQSLKLGHKVDL